MEAFRPPAFLIWGILFFQRGFGMSNEPLLRLSGIGKSFSGNTVLSGVDFSVQPGEIVSLAGENGAGKSTLMNILFGMDVIQRTGGYQGKIIFDGKEVQIKSPMEAMALGIGMVHQEFMLIPGFSIARNIKLNREDLKANSIGRVFGKNFEELDIPKMTASAESSVRRLGLDVDVSSLVERESVGTKQFVEIAREVNKENLKLLILDEPTAVLTETETDRFLECIRSIAKDGIAVIFISHRLDEIMKLSHRVVILRDGKLVFNKLTKDTTKREIASVMVGRNMGGEEKKADDGSRKRKGDVILSFKDYAVSMPGERTRGVDLDVYEGEILGIGGLAGQGKASIASGLFGLYPTKGTVTYKNAVLKPSVTGDALARKFAYVSEDRKNVGLLLDQSIAFNIVFTKMKLDHSYLKKVGPFSIYDRAAADRAAEEMIEKFDIRCTGPEELVGSLSGGNQQKVCIARALLTEPDILFVSEPTRGIDIGAKKLILDYLQQINREKGITIVMTSSELNELRSVCDRIAIITEGVVKGILPATSPEVDFALLMSGENVEKGEALA